MERIFDEAEKTSCVTSEAGGTAGYLQAWTFCDILSRRTALG